MDHADLPGVAAAQAARTGWAKVVADWRADDAPLPVEVLTAVVEAVHAAGGRVAVHTQNRAGGEASVPACADRAEPGARSAHPVPAVTRGAGPPGWACGPA